jgi:hypothetical protein
LAQKEELQRAAVYAAANEARSQGFDPANEAPAVVAALASHQATHTELKGLLEDWVKNA